MDFEKIPPQRDIIAELFPDRETFRKKVEEALEWSRRGGPMRGTSGFIKAVVGKIEISGDDFAELKKEINKEIKSLEKDQRESRKGFTQKETEKMIRDSKKQKWRELKRSGGVDPNEI